MSKIQTPYRYDFVGSFLRPQALEEAKSGISGMENCQQGGSLIGSRRRRYAKVVAKQKELGLPCDYRRGVQKKLSGIWISCGDLMESPIKIQVMA